MSTFFDKQKRNNEVNIIMPRATDYWIRKRDCRKWKMPKRVRDCTCLSWHTHCNLLLNSSWFSHISSCICLMIKNNKVICSATQVSYYSNKDQFYGCSGYYSWCGIPHFGPHSKASLCYHGLYLFACIPYPLGENCFTDTFQDMVCRHKVQWFPVPFLRFFAGKLYSTYIIV